MVKVQSAKKLLEDFLKNDLKETHNKEKTTNLSQKLSFIPREPKDVYNISAPFFNNGELIIAGRVEDRNSEDSTLAFFKQRGNEWVEDTSLPTFRLQDPFVTRIRGELVVGGVEVYPDPANSEALAYRTIFLKGKNIEELSKFTQGPEKMKDIRLLELDDERILVFTRPQGVIGGRGQIGYTYIKDLDELSATTICNATILTEQFISEEWGGANELHLLSNGWVGVLAHIAYFDEIGDRHYHSCVFGFNPMTNDFTAMKIIATRMNFEQGPAKRPDLVDVIFSGGIIRHPDKTATLYCGVSDAEAHCITITDPFLEYEQL